MIDVLTINNLYLGYNLYGLWETGWVSNVRIRNIFGYENQRSLIHAETKCVFMVATLLSLSARLTFPAAAVPIPCIPRSQVGRRQV